MIRILTIIILLFNKSLISQDFKLVCSEINSSVDIGLSKDFAKIVNFKNQTIVNYSGEFLIMWFYLVEMKLFSIIKFLIPGALLIFPLTNG